MEFKEDEHDHANHSGHLCSKSQVGVDEFFIDHVKNGKFICKKCGRVAIKEEYLCFPMAL